MVLIAAGLVLAACSTGQSPPRAAEADSVGLGHIHGVGVDPADDAVYVATHAGLFRVADGDPAVRVGPTRDVMGFTVTGPRTFLASGHPGPEEDVESPHLGLQSSRDAGRSWDHVSEAGRADFHALAPAGTSLYTFDSLSGQVRRSTDGGVTWTVGAAIPALDLAAHPSKPERVFATTDSGLLRSSDGGLTFAPVAGAPPLIAVEQPAAGVLVGVLADGRVMRGAPDSLTWQRAGSVPAAQVTALGAAGARTVLIATQQGVYRSDDAGAAFTLLPGTAP